MVRVAGVILDDKKHIVVALRKIYGVGKITSFYVCKKAYISPYAKVSELDDAAVLEIQKIVSKFEVEGNLRTRVRLNVKRLRDIKCYRGSRHKVSLPVRGQRTKTNAKTRKKARKNNQQI